MLTDKQKKFIDKFDSARELMRVVIKKVPYNQLKEILYYHSRKKDRQDLENKHK